MPSYRRGFSRRRGAMSLNVVNSIKNVHRSQFGLTGANTETILAKAVNTPLSTVSSDVSNGCIIKAVYCIIDFCGTGGTGVLNVVDGYLMKNPGANLTPPAAIGVGTSNEKKFVFKQWRSMAMRNQDGNNPFHWEGWIKIPKRYQRMGTDDTLITQFACTTALTGHASVEFIYKWYR